jgi:hypothetical protein
MKTLACSILLASSAAALAAELTIDDVAPPDSVLVARISDMSRTMDALRATSLWTLSEDPAVREWFGLIKESFDDSDLLDQLDRLGLDWEDIPVPTGHVGFALWEGEQWSAEDPPIIIMADFGEQAEEFMDLALDLGDQLEEEGRVEIAVDDYGPHELFTLTFVPPAERVQERLRQREQLIKEGWTEEELDEFGITPLEPGEGFLTRAGGVVFFSNNLDRAQAALDAADGRDIESLIGDAPIALGRQRLGEAHADIVFKAGMVIEDLLTGLEDSAFLAVPQEAVTATGIRELGVVSAGLRLSADEGQAVMDFFMEVDEPLGFFALPATLDGFDPPEFLGPNPVSYSALGIDWTRIIPTAQQVVLALPKETRAEAEAALTAFAVAAAPVFQSLGPELHVATTLRRPFAADSQANLIAVPVINEAAVVGAITQYAQGLGAQVREFLGHQIWQTPAMIGPPMSVGVGAGWVFIGQPSVVESAFRQLAAEDQPDAARLENDPSFQDAASRVAPAAVLYSYTDTPQFLDYLQWTGENVDRVIRAQFDGQPWQPEEEFLQTMVEEAENSLWFRLLRTLPVEAMNSVLGGQIQEIRRIEDGYRGRWIVLRPLR